MSLRTIIPLLIFLILSISTLNNATANSPNIKDLETQLRYKVVGNEWKETIVAADALLKYRPKDANAHYEKGAALAHLGKRREAIVSFDLAIKYKFKYLGLVYYEKGNSLKALKMLEEALQCYNKAIKVGFEDRWLYDARDDVLMELGRLGKGLDPI